ncbi:MAG: hypothetical protein WA738_15000 [Candidatus Angelobacter sp.]
MKMRGGDWSKGDFIALVSLAVALASMVAAILVVPEIRLYVGLDHPSPAPANSPAPSPTSYPREQNESARHAANKAAHMLGTTVAWLNFYSTNKPSNPEPEDIHRMIEQKWAELDSALKDLHIPVDSSKLDFHCGEKKDYRDSDAARFFADQVPAKNGEEAGRAYIVGLEIMGSFWIAQRQQFALDKRSGPAFPALETLSKLNEDAKKFGAEAVSSTELESAADPKSLNDLLQSLLLELDSRVQKVL